MVSALIKLTATPFASALLLDQSGSINQSDPTGARLFSTKAFLGGLGDQDRVVLAAFAAGPDARIPNPPLTVFAPFRDAATAPAYFSTLDSLSSLVGGNSPLYDSLDSLQQQLASDTTLPVGLPKAVVVFTDGADTRCGDAQACRTRRGMFKAGGTLLVRVQVRVGAEQFDVPFVVGIP